MTKPNFDPGEAYYANGLFKTLGTVGTHLFSSVVILREVLRRDKDRGNKSIFNAKELHPDGEQRSIVVQGVDVIAAFEKLSKITGVDLLDQTQYRVYGKVQSVNKKYNTLFDDNETILANKHAGLFVIRAVLPDEDKSDLTLHKLYFFTREYVMSCEEKEHPGFNNGRVGRKFNINKAILVL